MKIELLIIVLIISISSNSFYCFGQSNYTSGYIITNTSDTVNGYFLTTNINSYKKCVFKTDIDGATTDYIAGEIKAYRFNNSGKFFISKKVSLNNESKEYFLEYLIKGKANIYFLRENTEHFYIETDNNGLMELSEIPKLQKNKEGALYYKPAEYTGKLKYILSDCPEIYNDIDKTKLYTKDLIKLAKNYHDKVCDSEQCIIFERKDQPIKTNWKVFGGLSYNNFIFNAKNYTDYRYNPSIGFTCEVHNLFFSAEQIFLKMGTSFQRYGNYTYKTEAKIIDNVIYHGDYQYQINFKALTMDIPVSINYQFSTSKIKPYAGVGISSIIFLNQNKDLYAPEFNYYFGKAIPTYHVGYFCSLGVKFNIAENHDIDLEVLAQKAYNTNPNLILRITNNYLSIKAGYTF